MRNLRTWDSQGCCRTREVFCESSSSMHFLMLHRARGSAIGGLLLNAACSAVPRRRLRRNTSHSSCTGLTESACMRCRMRRLVVERTHPVIPLPAPVALHPVLLLGVLWLLRLELTTALYWHLSERVKRDLALSDRDHGGRVDNDTTPWLWDCGCAPCAFTAGGRLLVACRA